MPLLAPLDQLADLAARLAPAAGPTFGPAAAPSAQLAGYSNIALYSAMAVYTVAMLLFAGHLAALGPVAVPTAARRELVPAGAATRAGSARPRPAPPPRTRPPTPTAPTPPARRWAVRGPSLRARKFGRQRLRHDLPGHPLCWSGRSCCAGWP
jgi:hypothetical protein